MKYLLGINDEEGPSILGPSRILAMAESINEMTSGEGTTEIRIDSSWYGDVGWGNNKIRNTADYRDCNVFIVRRLGDRNAFKNINQIDEVTLRETVRFVEESARMSRRGRASHRRMNADPQRLNTVAANELPPSTWSEATASISLKQRVDAAASLVTRCESRKVLSSGFLEWRSHETMGFVFGTFDHSSGPNNFNHPPLDYIQHTQAQCSLTAFTAGGDRLGWAGLSSYDWNLIDPNVLAEHAIERCLSTVVKGRLEPGKYTVVLEPQATATLATSLFNSLDRVKAETGGNPFAYAPDRQLGVWRTRLGMKVVDDRVSISHDPNDPAMRVLPVAGLSDVTWIEKGVLKNLAYNEWYAQTLLGETDFYPYRPSFRIDGGSASLEDIISSTEDGLLISRLSTPLVLDGVSLLSTGFTRDGVWHIKNGQIMSYYHNMRFTDSPLTSFNALQEIGAAKSVFMPSTSILMPVMAPPIRVSRFSLTASAPVL